MRFCWLFRSMNSMEGEERSRSLRRPNHRASEFPSLPKGGGSAEENSVEHQTLVEEGEKLLALRPLGRVEMIPRGLEKREKALVPAHRFPLEGSGPSGPLETLPIEHPGNERWEEFSMQQFSHPKPRRGRLPGQKAFGWALGSHDHLPGGPRRDFRGKEGLPPRVNHASLEMQFDLPG